MADKYSHEEYSMWPSSETASWLYKFGNIGLIIGLIFTFVSTILVIWMGGVKEKYLNTDLEAEHTARTKLENKLASRVLSQSQINELSEKLKSFAGMRADIVAYPHGHPDIIPLSGQLNILLQKANWNTKWFKTMGGGSCTGIAVQTKVGSDDNFELAANLLVAQLNNIGIAAGRVESFTDNWPPGGGVFGDLWDNDAVAPIRISIGTKP